MTLGMIMDAGVTGEYLFMNSLSLQEGFQAWVRLWFRLKWREAGSTTGSGSLPHMAEMCFGIYHGNWGNTKAVSLSLLLSTVVWVW